MRDKRLRIKEEEHNILKKEEEKKKYICEKELVFAVLFRTDNITISYHIQREIELRNCYYDN